MFLSLFEAYKDLDVQVSSERFVPATEDVQNLWAVPNSLRSTDSADMTVSEIMAVYGVEGDPDPDSDGEEEIVDLPTIQAALGSSTSTNPNPSPQRTSTYLEFQYDVESAVATAVQNGRLGEWTCIELRSICLKFDLSTRGAKAALLQRILSHLAPTQG